ncbi:Hpt domain-containing protein [Bradyrhizobium ontarionense]|uniref:Hpt domain-containing protein n=1 Tax=Bradyrhizobium ontarionense TaxID=2898149 RepID=A0ABY3RKI8_9BRAD|nr:Hpt domain-containing protein [Bradyrhizobium sp. A19]UFZ07981.1 Hpt domain-containing protein [Bradyrhizobium sp. A19]
MYADEFELRIAKVRQRFATSLENKIEVAMIAADRMSGGKGSEIDHVQDSYRCLHNICGVGPTVGFAATGDAARAAESALMQAYQEKRALTDEEVQNLKTALEHLRDIAASELKLMYERGH